MLDRLDDIPWNCLTHAYGSAKDIPDLLRSLRTEPTETGEDLPLWQLFSNIWHQGTVYEATAYAVPFLIELAACPQVPDRIIILELLALIATGSSFRQVHGDVMNEPDFAERKAVELEWVEQAHAAVARGVGALLAMTEEKSDIRLAAAHLLALLPEHREIVCARLRIMTKAETGSLQRAGLLLLLGLADDRSEAALAMLSDATLSDDPMQRHGAAFSYAYLKPDPLPDLARAAILEAIARDDLEKSFDGIPWDVTADIDREKLYACLDAASREEAATTGIVAVETGKATRQTVDTVLNLIFPLRQRQTPLLAGSELSPLQKRAVRAISSAMDDGRRIASGPFRRWGLPETAVGWRALAFDEEPPRADSRLP